MTEQEKQQIIQEILAGLAANSQTIDDLLEELNITDKDYFEINRGRKVKVSLLIDIIKNDLIGKFASKEDITDLAKIKDIPNIASPISYHNNIDYDMLLPISKFTYYVNKETSTISKKGVLKSISIKSSMPESISVAAFVIDRENFYDMIHDYGTIDTVSGINEISIDDDFILPIGCVIGVKPQYSNQIYYENVSGGISLEHISLNNESKYLSNESHESYSFGFTMEEITPFIPLYNVSIQHSNFAYANKQSARNEVPGTRRVLGQEVTYKLSSSEWITEKFIGKDLTKWADETSWEQFANKSDIGNLNDKFGDYYTSSEVDNALSSQRESITEEISEATKEFVTGETVTDQITEATKDFETKENVKKLTDISLSEGNTIERKEDGLFVNVPEVPEQEDGALVNITESYPLESGYYTIDTAIAAIPEDKRRLGLVITFAITDDSWKSYQYNGSVIDTGSWSVSGLWVEYGGGGSVKSITSNGETFTPDEDGNIAFPIQEIEIDESLDASSTNPVENRAVAAKVSELEASTLFGSDVDVDEDNNTVTVSLTNKSGASITEFTIPAGTGGGGGGEAAATKIILNSSVSSNIIKEGSPVELTYTYDHQYTSGEEAGESTGQKATVEIQIKRGAQIVFSQTIPDVSKGTYTLDISQHLFVGTMDVYVIASTNDPVTGSAQRKQSYQSIRVLTLSLSSSYNLASNISGYAAGTTAVIPYTVNGSGNKIITMYVDGVQKDTTTVSKSGTTNGSFTLPVSSLTFGRHTIQLRAELEASADLTILSESIYFDILKRQESTYQFIATKIISKDGRIFGPADHLTPRFEVQQYEPVEFDFVAYDSSRNPAIMDVYNNGVKTQTISAPRTNQVYSNRFTESGEVQMKFACGNVEYPFFFEVVESDLDIEEIKDGLVLRLSAAGRSNQEENPAQWSYEDIQTTFNGFDFDSSGWTGDTLKLVNGANIEVDYKPFGFDASGTGATYEIELECSNVIDRNGVIVDCMSEGVGFQITTQEALLSSAANESVSSLFAPMLLKISFVVEQKSANRLLHLYINGIRSGVAQYAQDDSFLQQNPVNLKVLSDSADVEVRSIRVYNKALTDDECLQNFIVDRTSINDMVMLVNNNDVLNDLGEVDIEKLRSQGKTVIRIVGDVNLVNQTNDKKFEVPVDIYFYSKYGKEYDFVAKRVGLRIQGTSSTTYPRKNYRFYMNRFSKYGSELYVNGVLVPDFKYALKPGAKRMDIFCPKADYAESSSTHNTGTAVLINDVWKKCGFLTPPQYFDDTVRTAVDGIPCDMWYDNDGTNVNIHLGKYNFNTEKSGSADLYGFEKVEGFNDEETLAGRRNPCVCLEFLNNSEQLCLFTTDDMSRFDEALEFRYPDDTVWNSAHIDSKAAIQRLWSWVYACRNNPTKFANEVAQYFNLDNLCAWYLYTDYFMGVDQRAKNQMLATWDGETWFYIPYDNDTILGVRNDGVLKYPYTITEETFDDEIQSYAFAGHDSILWKLVRENLKSDLSRVAGVFRSNMSNNEVLSAYNEYLMANWSERVYNKDGEYKYIQPLIDGVDMGNPEPTYYNYLYSLQGSRFAHRSFIIQNRFALMDAQYVVGGYRADGFTAYFGHAFSTDNRNVKIGASERYFFGYGYSSGAPKQSGVLAEDENSIVTLILDTNLIVNDPQVFYGASRMRVLDLTDVSEKILQTLNLNNCKSLERLLMRSSRNVNNTTLNNILITGCRLLKEIDMTGIRSTQFTGIDLSGNTRLEKFLAGNTSLVGVTFAAGSPLMQAILPSTLEAIELRSLKNLENSGLTLQNPSTLTRLIVDGCPKIDWQSLLALCVNMRYLRVTDIRMEGDGALLRQLLSMGGVDESGANTSTCRLVGEYRLTSSITEEEYEVLFTHFPELRITQPEYTMIEFDDDVADDRNVSNLDNKTGYKYGNDYVPSGHIVKILNRRFGCLGKQAEEGNMSICKLHDENFHYYADADKVENASEAKLDSTEGDVFIYEPKYWRKGINDYLNEKKYSCYSSNAEMPPVPEAAIVTLDEIISKSRYINKYKLISGFSTVSEAYSSDNNYSVCQIEVDEYKKVRFPTVLGTSLVCSVFTDEEGNVVEEVSVPVIGNGFENGMYLIKNIPKNSKYLYFSIWNNADWDNVVLSNSDKIEDMEPDWVFTDECLVGVFQANTIGKSLYSAAVGSAMGVGGLSYEVFKIYAKARNLQLADYEMSNSVANLFFAKYGRKNSQDQCGYGYGSISTEMGITAFLGMKDTVNQEGATIYSYYEDKDQFGNTILVHINKEKVMGYEGWTSERYEYLGGVEIPNSPSSEAYKFHITMPDGKVRKVKASNTTGYITGIVHQKYMDVIKAGSGIGGSDTTYYSDYFWASGSANRVLLRFGAYSVGTAGICSLYYTPNKDDTNGSFASRLAFRGKITLINSANQFKQIKAKW